MRKIHHLCYSISKAKQKGCYDEPEKQMKNLGFSVIRRFATPKKDEQDFIVEDYDFETPEYITVKSSSIVFEHEEKLKDIKKKIAKLQEKEKLLEEQQYIFSLLPEWLKSENDIAFYRIKNNTEIRGKCTKCRNQYSSYDVWRTEYLCNGWGTFMLTIMQCESCSVADIYYAELIYG